MKKFLCLSLCIALLLAVLPSAAYAVETFTTSEEGIAFIKEFEDYRATPYEDNGKWYIGYGTLCEKGDYPNGISQDEAERLMRECVEVAEDLVNNLLLTYGIAVTQYQFDAMVDMAYNLGTQWMNPTYRFCSYLISGIGQYTEAQVVNAIATWCHQGTTVRTNLVTRRLRCAYLFLYGMYQNDGPSAYTYIHFDPNGGSMENRTVFYPTGWAYGELPAPVLSGQAFAGWYTAEGYQLTGQETASAPLEATARWGDGTSTEAPSIPQTPEIDLSGWVNPYSDVKEDDWFFSYVRELSAYDVVGGYPDGTFRADRTLSAGEALKLILLAAGKTDPGNSAGGHWASNYLILAESLGCVEAWEVPDLDGPISRGLIAKIACAAMGLTPRSGASPFVDVDNGYALTLYEEGILNGTVSEGLRFFYPDNSIIRSEMCAIVSRIRNWDYVEAVDPGQAGFIQYRDQFLPLLRNVPAAPYNKDLFVLDGSTMYYNDPAYSTALGVDVSSYQGEEIDWAKVAASGIEFVMIRVGYRGYGTEGTLNLDSCFQKNLAGAKAAGLKVGAYFFSQAINTAEAAQEAQFVLQALAGQALDYPLVYDWEVISADGARTKGLDNTTLTDCAITFCESVRMAGYTPMVYYNLPVGYLHYQLDRLTAYDVWFAQYASMPSMYYNYRIWQYSDKGSVPGIPGKVDMNIAFLPY